MPAIAKKLSDNLVAKELIDPLVPVNTLLQEVELLLFEELTVEDRLNAEVRELLKKYEPEIEKGRLDYKRLFDMTKKKLVKERNVVL